MLPVFQDRGAMTLRSARLNHPKLPVGTKKSVEGVFGYGESEYEASFGIVPRSGELSSSDPETSEPFNSPFRARNPERGSDSNSPQKLGSASQNLGSRGIYTRR